MQREGNGMTREQLLIERVRDLKAVGAKHEHLAKIVADQYEKWKQQALAMVDEWYAPTLMDSADRK